MRFRRDRRAAALQVGAVLLLGFLVIGLSLYQATVVPEQNKRVEFRHSQAVQNDMVEVRNALQRAGTSEDVQSVAVDMGTTYRARVFFVNPAPPGGTIRNGTDRSATFANVSATNDETADFLNTSANGPHDLATKNLTYRPSYNVYQSAPTTAYGSGVLVNEFENANDTAVTDQALIRGKEIYLVAVRGNLSRAQVGAYAVDPESLSTATASTTVRNESGAVNVTVPTTLTEERWERLLDDQDRVKSVTKQGGRVTVLLKPGTYRLRTALVGIGTGAEAPGPAYLTTVDPEGGADVAVEVRDRFNNPVPNSRVDGNLTVNVTSGGDALDATNVSVGDDGRARFDAVGGGNASLRLEEDGSPALGAENGSVDITVDNRPLVVLADVDKGFGTDSQINLTVRNEGGRRATFTGYRLDYAWQINYGGGSDILVDGANRIEQVTFDGTTVTGTAEEHRGRYEFTPSERSDVAALAPGEEYDTTVSLDAAIDGEDAVLQFAFYVKDVGAVRFAVSYTGGSGGGGGGPGGGGPGGGP